MDPDDRLPAWVNPETTVRLDPMSIRGLAHPTRLKILGILRAEGPATATKLAERLGMNTGATSYHLRQLAGYGFIAEDAERGSARERWWRAAHATTFFDRDDLAGEESGEAYMRAVAQGNAERILRAADEFGTLPRVWRAAGTMSDVFLDLTPYEARRLRDEVFEVLGRFRRHDPEAPEPPPEGAAPVSVQLQVIPHAHAITGERGA